MEWRRERKEQEKALLTAMVVRHTIKVSDR